MIPAARLQAAIEILDGLDKTAQPADGYLRDWGRSHRFAGSKDRAAITERVYTALRHRASLSWRMNDTDGRALVLASLLAQNETPDRIAQLFNGEGHAPKPLSDAERAVLDAAPQGEPPAHVRGEYPLWLEPELLRAFGNDLPDEMHAMNARACVDLRVNTLRAAARDDMLEGLRSLNVDAQRTPFSPVGIRVASGEGLGSLQHTQFFQTGAFEFQDESSQLVTQLHVLLDHGVVAFAAFRQAPLVHPCIPGGAPIIGAVLNNVALDQHPYYFAPYVRRPYGALPAAQED